MSGRTATVVGVAVLVLGAGSQLSPRQAHRTASRDVPATVEGPHSTFAALWSSPATHKMPEVAAFSAATGSLLHRLVPLPGSGTSVTGPFAAMDGSLWYSSSRGPRERSGVAGGDPAPGSCASGIFRFDPKTNRTSEVIQGRSDLLIEGAVVSPGGNQIVYNSEGCTGFLDWHVVIRDLQTGATHTVGADAAPCHHVSLPVWSPDGSRLAFAWGDPRSSRGSPALAPGTCTNPRPDRLAVVPADRSGAVRARELHAADPGCRYAAVAFDKWGVAAVETCGHLTHERTRFIQLDARLRPTLRLALPMNADGTTLAANRSGTKVMVDEYQTPDPTTSRPTEWVEVFDGHSLRTVVQDRTGVDSLTFATWYRPT